MAPPHAQTWGGASSSEAEAERIHALTPNPSSLLLDGAAILGRSRSTCELSHHPRLVCKHFVCKFGPETSQRAGFPGCSTQEISRLDESSRPRQSHGFGWFDVLAQVGWPSPELEGLPRPSRPVRKERASPLPYAGNQPRTGLLSARHRRVRSLARKAAKAIPPALL